MVIKDIFFNRKRNIEFLLIIVGFIIIFSAHFLVNINENEKEDQANFTVRIIIMYALTMFMHIILRIKYKYADPIILPISIILNGLGLAMIHRIDLAFLTKDADRQFAWTIVSISIAMFVQIIIKNYKLLNKFTYVSLLFSIILLFLPIIFGENINGANVWINIKGLSFQPGEIAKITLAIFCAGYLSSKRELILLEKKKTIKIFNLSNIKNIGPIIVACLCSISILIFQRDLGSSLLFFGLFMAMVYMATSKISWIIIGSSLMSIGALIASMVFPHISLRVDNWINGFSQEAYMRRVGGSSQILQGLFGMSSGGLFGTGFGQGRPDLIPFSKSDMIIAAFGEELGLLGLFFIILLYFILITQGLKIALNMKDIFGKLLACGLSFSIAIQCFVVIGGVTMVIPLTGLTTPFLAQGGSSLLANWIIISLLFILSHSSRIQAKNIE